MKPLGLILFCVAFVGCSDDGVKVVDSDHDGVRDELDCAPNDDAIFPGAIEICNGFDDDCAPGTVEAGAHVVGGGSYGDLQAAIDAAPAGATVQVCGGTYPVHLLVERDLVLESFAGRDATVLDAGGAGSAIQVRDGADLTLRGFTVIGGTGVDMSGFVDFMNDDDGGGGIFAGGAGAILVEDSRFSAHVANSGGAIAVLASESLTVRDTILSDNTAHVLGGGVLVFDADDVLFERVSAYGNTADYGAAILLVVVHDACTLSKLDVHHNATVRGEIPPGGALSVELGDCNITDSLFENNVAEARGGALSLTTGTMSLTRTIIRGNHAQEGGGIYVLAYEGDTTVEADADTLVADNVASAGGGGMVAYAHSGYTITLRGFSFDHNLALLGGGLASYQDSGGAVVVEGATFTDNAALSLGGGGLAAQGGTLRLSDATFIGNGASETRNSDSGLGGGAFVRNAAVDMDGVVFDRNAASSGGGLGLWAPASCTLKDLQVMRNHTGSDAGGMFLVSNPNGGGRSRCVLSDSLFEHNLSNAWGGGVDVVGATLELERVTIRNNRSSYGGGMNLYDVQGRGAVVEGDGVSTIEGNEAFVMGGGVVVWPSFGMPLGLEGVIVSGNEADRGGGIAIPRVHPDICSESALGDLVISGNTALVGGGLWLECPTTLRGSRVISNQAPIGGGVYLDLGTFTSSDSDWGEGKLDNGPHDVMVGGSAYTFGAGVDFVCDAATATCQ